MDTGNPKAKSCLLSSAAGEAIGMTGQSLRAGSLESDGHGSLGDPSPFVSLLSSWLVVALVAVGRVISPTSSDF
jgi:hypothetical protein